MTSSDAQVRRGRPLVSIAREWTRIGVVGFGGPPAHIALLRQLVLGRRWMNPRAFADALAACNLLPGPASTQLAIYCAYRVGGPIGAMVGGLGFVLPAVAMILALSPLFLGHAPPLWARGAGAGAGAAVAAVAVRAGSDLLISSYRHARERMPALRRWFAYVLGGGTVAALAGPYLVLMLLACGLVELASQRSRDGASGSSSPLTLASVAAVKGSLAALAWTAFKVGALAFGGGFVIVPLMQADAVHAYHWMTDTQFLNAVALGQVTPGPVVATVAAVGYAAAGLGGGLLAAAIAFAPSFTFVLLGGGRFERLRENRTAVAFLDGAAPAAIGAILGSAVPLAAALHSAWQAGVLAAAALALLILRRGIVETLLCAAAIGVLVALAGGSVA